MLATSRAAAARPLIRGGARFLAVGRRPHLQRIQQPSAEAQADYQSGLVRLQQRDHVGAAQAFELASERGSAPGALYAALSHDGLLGGGIIAAGRQAPPSTGLGSLSAADHYQRAAEAGKRCLTGIRASAEERAERAERADGGEQGECIVVPIYLTHEN